MKRPCSTLPRWKRCLILHALALMSPEGEYVELTSEAEASLRMVSHQAPSLPKPVNPRHLYDPQYFTATKAFSSALNILDDDQLLNSFNFQGLLSFVTEKPMRMDVFEKLCFSFDNICDGPATMAQGLESIIDATKDDAVRVRVRAAAAHWLHIWPEHYIGLPESFMRKMHIALTPQRVAAADWSEEARRAAAKAALSLLMLQRRWRGGGEVALLPKDIAKMIAQMVYFDSYEQFHAPLCVSLCKEFVNLPKMLLSFNPKGTF